MDGTSAITAYDVYLFREGTHFRLHAKLGAHPNAHEGRGGTRFALWAPAAHAVSVVGDFNGWREGETPLVCRHDGSGIWEGFVPRVGNGSAYLFHISSPGFSALRGDPFARRWREIPGRACLVWEPEQEWGDSEWLRRRSTTAIRERPLSISQVDLRSWNTSGGAGPLSFRDAGPLCEYAERGGFTHVEFLPLTDDSVCCGDLSPPFAFFAPSAGLGGPEELMHVVDSLHRRGIGVIAHWTPASFSADESGLALFDGTPLYEHPERNRIGDGSRFDLDRSEVRAFLVSSAFFWLESFHLDGLVVDGISPPDPAPAGDGEGLPADREERGEASFLRRLTATVKERFPGVATVAGSSVAPPLATRPAEEGGFGFTFRWNDGWTREILDYLSSDPVDRKYRHNQLTCSFFDAFSESFILPLSFREFAPGCRPLAERMPGDHFQREANIRLLMGYLFAHPGKKLLFGGSGFRGGERSAGEVSHEMLRWIEDLNRLYRETPALHRVEDERGFAWCDARDWEKSVISFLRIDPAGGSPVLVVCNFTPVPRSNYRIGVPHGGVWRELLNSDALFYGGSGYGNFGAAATTPVPFHGEYRSLSLTLPPLAILFFRHEEPEDA